VSDEAHYITENDDEPICAMCAASVIWVAAHDDVGRFLVGGEWSHRRAELNNDHRAWVTK